MIRIALLVLLLLAGSLPRSSAQTAYTPEERSLINCMAHIRYGLQYYTPLQKPYDYDAYVDTLYNYLYDAPVKAQISLRILSRLTLQCYFIETGDARIDYEDIGKALRTTRNSPAFHDAYFFTCARAMADYQETQADWLSAVEMRDWALAALPKVLGKSETPMAYGLYKQNSALCLQHLRDYRRSADYAWQTCHIAEVLEGTASPAYREELGTLASICHIAGEYQRADSCFSLLQQLMEQSGPYDPDEYRSLLLDRADVLRNAGRPAQAASCYRQALSHTAADDGLYPRILYELAALYYEQADYRHMLPVMRQGIGCLEKAIPANTDDIFHYLDLCNAPNVGKERKRLLRLSKKSVREDDVPSLATLAYAYRKNYEYSASDELLQQVVALMDAYAATGDTARFEAGLPYAQVLLTGSRYQDKNIEYLWHNLHTCQQQFGASHPIVLDVANLITSQHNVAGNYRQAIRLADSCLTLPTLTTRQRYLFLQDKASALTSIGQFLQAIEVNRQALPLAQGASEIWDIRANGIAGNLMAEIDIHQTNSQDELTRVNLTAMKDTLLHEALALMALAKEEPEGRPQEYILASEYLASAYCLSGQYDKMIRTASDCEDTIRKHVYNQELKALYLECLAPFYICTGNYAKALTLIDEEGLDGRSQSFAERSNTLTLLAETALGMKKPKRAERYYEQQARSIIHETEKNFASLTEAGRYYYWRMYRQYIYNAGKFISETGKPSDFAGTVYDLALFAKGLLLNSSRQLERQILESGDDGLVKQYNEWKDLRSALANTPSLTPDERKELNDKADRLETRIMEKARTYGDYTRYLRTHWQDVRARLGKNATAIEFIDYQRQDSTEMYGALLLSQRWDKPLFVPLIEKERYDSIASAMAVDATTGHPIWQPLMPYLAETEDIYFSPTGILHKLPVEYMPCPNDSLGMNERYHIYRLSSTRLLTRPQTSRPIRQAALYGGLEYDATPVVLSETDRRQTRVLRLPYLQGTEREVTDIMPFFTQKHITPQLYTGEEGTEESFKALSGQPVNLIHLATHGYYLPLYDETLAQIPSLHLSATTKDEDRTLLNTAVCFAGINNAHLASDLDTSNDGYLSAKEIAAMDLHAAGLVVLSACLTAEGEVTGEGVFGLQRGFKQAGAGTLIMSSWKVDDQATHLLMTGFYRHLLAGQSKREAFLAAQQELRRNTKYASPKYWAAFIMLDGLN